LLLAETVTLLFLGFGASSAVASSGIITDSDEDTALPALAPSPPSLNMQMVDRGRVDDAAADMRASAVELASDKMASPTLVDDNELTDDVEDNAADDASSPVTDTPETALRLPGVAEQDLPHFRRQMYRTDI
jgi:hypothetical protein